MSDGGIASRGRDGWLYRLVGGRWLRDGAAPPTPPRDSAVLERARSLANEAAQAVSLQVGRIRSFSYDSDADPWQLLYDYQFLIGALARFDNAVSIAEHVPAVAGRVILIRKEFVDRVPGLRKMRNVLEHAEDYAVDAQHFGWNRRGRKEVLRQQLQVGSWTQESYEWLGETLTLDAALGAVSNAYAQLKEMQRAYDDGI